MNPDFQNVTDPIFHYAQTRPDAHALIESGSVVTYRELASLVAKATVYLKGLGIVSGQRVAVSMTNGIDHFVLSLGLMRLGATLMEMPYNSQHAPMTATLEKFGMTALFLESGIPAPPGYRSVTIYPSWRYTLDGLSGDERSPAKGDALFVVTLTSGTTGTPKGMLTTHAQYFKRLNAYTEIYAESGVFSADNPANFLLTANIGFSTFFRRTLSHLLIGGPVVILPSYTHVIDLIKAIASWDNALCYVTAAMCPVLVSYAPEKGLLFPRLRALIGGAGPLFGEEKLAMLSRVTPNFYHSYGASGFGTMAVLLPSAARSRPQSVGLPASFVEVQIADAQGDPVPTGVVGRLRCRGSHSKGLASGGEIDGDERFNDDWYSPGDLGYLDAEGYLFLKGRTVDIIRRPTGDIYASEIEEVILSHLSVKEVAVVGLPRRNGAPGDEIVAVIVADGAAQHEALAQHCRTKLPPERWPDQVFYSETLPKSASGKLDRAQVRGMAMAELHRRAGGRA